MAYNMTNITGGVHVLDLYKGVNVMSENMLVYGSLISLWIILFMVLLRRNPAPESLIAASTVCSILSMIFMLVGLLNVIWVFGFVFIIAVAAVALYVNR